MAYAQDGGDGFSALVAGTMDGGEEITLPSTTTQGPKTRWIVGLPCTNK